MLVRKAPGSIFSGVVPGSEFRPAIHFPDASEPVRPWQVPTEGPQKPAEVTAPNVGQDLISLVADTPAGTPEAREVQSSLLSEIVGIIERAKAFHIETMRGRQNQAIIERDGLHKRCRLLEDEMKQLSWELGGLNSKLNDQGIARQRAQAEWEGAKQQFPESRFPTEGEIQEKSDREERTRLVLVTAQQNYSGISQQAANKQSQLARKQAELREVEDQLDRLNCAINGTPYADRATGGLVTIPRL
jgi:hypothetical protein